VLWANMHLLFWLSLLPFATGWIGEHPEAAAPTALYGAVCLACGIAWLILQSALVRLHGNDSTFARALGSDLKGRSPRSRTPRASGSPTSSTGPRSGST